MVATILILLILLFAAVCALAWQQLELNAARRELRQAEREAAGYRDDLWRRDRLGVRPKEMR